MEINKKNKYKQIKNKENKLIIKKKIYIYIYIFN